MKAKLLYLCLLMALMFACSITPVVTDADATQPAYKSATLARPVAELVLQADGRKAGP